MDLIPNETIIYMWLIFMSSFVVINQLIIKPTLPIILARRQKSQGQASEAKHLAEQAIQKMKKYDSVIAEARLAGSQARDLIVRSAETEAKEIISKARTQAEEVVSRGKAQIETEAQAVRAQLGPMSQALAVEMANKLMQRKAA